MGKKVIFVGLVVLMLAAAAAAQNPFLVLVGTRASRSGSPSGAIGGRFVNFHRDNTESDFLHTEQSSTDVIAGGVAGAIGAGGSSSSAHVDLVAGSQTNNDDMVEQELVVGSAQNIQTDDGFNVAFGVHGSHTEQQQSETTWTSARSQSQAVTVIQGGVAGGLPGSEASVEQGAIVYSYQSQNKDDE
jgi:hypothetical protein